MDIFGKEIRGGLDGQQTVAWARHVLKSSIGYLAESDIKHINTTDIFNVCGLLSYMMVSAYIAEFSPTKELKKPESSN